MTFNSFTHPVVHELLDAVELLNCIGTTHDNPYIVPRGFLSETYDSRLHKQLRFLRDFGSLKPVEVGLTDYEGWLR